MNKIKSYNEYKTTDISRIGNIPKDWDLVKLRFLTRITTGNKNTEDKEINGDYNFYVRSQKVAKISSYSFDGEGILTAGDGVGVGKVFHYVNEKFDYHQRVYLFYNFSSLVFGKFLFYYLREFLKIDLMLYNAKSTVDSVRLPTLKNFSISLPTTNEQTAIANFLDYKTTKIDRFIRKKKQLIKLLNEQKAGIINDAVTEGLDAYVKMKFSGIEWLGDIPEHWEVKPLKYIGYSVLGKMLCNEDKGGYFKKPYLKSKNIQWLNVNVVNVEEMWFSEKELHQYKLNKGDLILSEGGEVGKTCIWNNELEECYIQNSAHKITFNNLNIPEFYLYLFFLYGRKGAFEANTNRVSIGHLTKDKLINLKCVVPPLSEQLKIVSYIETETAKLNKAIATIEKEIALVQEYKTALIAEAVTGKIDVRDYVIPVFEEETEIEEEGEEELDLVEDGDVEIE